MLEYIKNLAVAAGKLALAEQAVLSADAVHTKATAKDIVTDADRKVEDFIVTMLKREFPDFAIFGEESGKSGQESDYCWVIDPIDGTAGFARKLPNWCVSIGLVHKGKSVLGAIYAPVKNELYYAEEGKGAFLNGIKMQVSAISDLESSIVVTGLGCLRANWKEENNLKYISRIAPLVGDLRKYGSAALDCCRIAHGVLDAYWELLLQPYDIAAGDIIAREAGAVITDFYGGADYPARGFLCTNGALHQTMLEFFSDYQDLRR